MFIRFLLEFRELRVHHATAPAFRVYVQLVLLVLLLQAPAPCSAESASIDASLAQQRKQFAEAEKLLRAGHVKDFDRIAGQLKDYPLYPYLRYDYLRQRLWQAGNEEIADFLDRYDDLPMAGDIRDSWLRLLAKRRDWHQFLKVYRPQQDPTLQCYQLLARISIGDDTYLLEDTRTLWLSGSSLPSQCDPAFRKLEASKLMTPDLVWQRIELAMRAGNTGLATYLGSKLPDDQRIWVRRWIETHENPWKYTADPGFEDVELARTILLYGVRRLARRDVDKAISHWTALEDKYNFTADQKESMQRDLAVLAAARGSDEARQLLDQLKSGNDDPDVFNWRLQIALQDHDWQALLKWTSGPAPGDEGGRERWTYWRARALEATGHGDAARELYESLAGSRDYYGFLSADRLGLAYSMKPRTLPRDAKTHKQLESTPGIVRARELYLLGRTYAARREWHHVLENLSNYQMQIAAGIAANWGWYDRAILTMGKAEAYDDLDLRFPLPYRQELKEYAERRQLDLSWVYALVRAESAFMEDARSPAGALGLMQVMPHTGRETAKTIGWHRFQVSQLLNPDTNIPIGTAYLKRMYDRFNHNMILATAAYNAGPAAVARWLPKTGCMQPDIWLEQIPLTETRNYVHRILYYASIYDWRLQHEITPVDGRMTQVLPQHGNVVAGLTCSGQSVSMK